MHADEVPARQRWADIERGNLVVRVVPVPRVALFARDRERRDGGAVDEVEVDAASAVREDELFLRVRHEFGKLTAAARCARPRRVARAIRRHTRRDDRRGDAAGDGRARDALGDDPVQPRDELAAVRRRDRSVILREVFRVTVRRSSAAAASGRVLAHRRERLSAVVAAEEVVLELRLAAAGLLRLAVGREERVDVLRGALLGVRHPVVDRSLASVDRSRARSLARDDRAWTRAGAGVRARATRALVVRVDRGERTEKILKGRRPQGSTRSITVRVPVKHLFSNHKKHFLVSEISIRPRSSHTAHPPTDIFHAARSDALTHEKQQPGHYSRSHLAPVARDTTFPRWVRRRANPLKTPM